MNKITYLRKRMADEYKNNDYESAVKLGETLLKEQHHNRYMYTRGYADDLYNLAQVYEGAGNLERAAGLYSDSARHMSALEGETIDFAHRLTGLAVVLGRMGVFDPAYYIHSQASHVYKNEAGQGSQTYADALYNLASAAADAGRSKEALRYHLDALKIREQNGKIPDVINSLHSIAFIYESSSDYKKAASYAEAAMDIASEDQDDREYLASSCHYLAGIYERLEKYDKALPLYIKVQEVIRQEEGRDHSAYLNVAYRKAHLLAQLGRPREAIECHEEICDIFQAMQGENHIFYANCLRNMALLHNGLGENAQAETRILQSMKIRRTTEDITSDIIFLIKLYLRTGNREKAMEALIYALMRSDTDAKEFSSLISDLTETFSETGATPTSEIMEAMEALNDKEKIAPIISKWAEWEAS